MTLSKSAVYLSIFTACQVTDRIDNYFISYGWNWNLLLIVVLVLGVAQYPVIVFNGSKRWLVWLVHLFRPDLEFIDLHMHGSVYYTLAKRRGDGYESYLNFIERHIAVRLDLDGKVYRLGEPMGNWFPMNKSKRVEHVLRNDLALVE